MTRHTPSPTANAQDVTDCAVAIEAILFRAVSQNKMDGYTLPLSHEIAAAVLAIPTTPPVLEDLRQWSNEAQALIQEAKGLAGNCDVTDHLDFAEQWLGKIDAALARATAA